MAKYTVTADMETKGFDKGSKNIKGQINSLSALGNQLGKAFKITGDTTKAQSGLNALRQSSVMAQSEVKRLQNNLSIMKMSGAPAEQIKQMETELNRAQATSQRLANSQDTLKNSMAGVKEEATKSGEGFTVMKGAMANLVSTGIEKTISGIGSALGGLASGLVNVTKGVVSAYSSYEQLVGGIDTLFKGSSQKVQANAQKAFQTAGLSANDYMEQVTSFSAALISSVAGDTNKAADLSDMAMRDMSDNANKMGSDMESITGTYQSLAKGNYAMLDNLKLGFGGTKTEMERLLKEAEKMPQAMGKKFDISNYGDVVQAIHVVQENMGITGTTAKEASSTIEGSFNSLKASWTNLLTGMGSQNLDLQPLVQNVINNAVNLVQNVTPVIENLFKALPTAITGLVEQIGSLIDILLPEITNIIIALANSLSTVIPMLGQSLMQYLPGLLTELISGLQKIVEALAVALPPLIPILGQAFIQLFMAFLTVLPTIIQNLVPAISQLIIQLVEAIPPMIPLLIDAFITLFNALVIAVPQIINALVPQIPIIIEALIDALPTMIDALIQGFITLFMALVDATPTIIKTLVPEIPKIIEALANTFIHTVGELNEGFSRMWDYFVASLPEILKTIGDAFVNLGTWIWNAMVGGLNDLWDSFTGWISDFASNIGNSMSNAVSNAVDGAMSWLGFANSPMDGLGGMQGMGGPEAISNPWVSGGFDTPLPMALQLFANKSLPMGNIVNGINNVKSGFNKGNQNGGNKTIVFDQTFNGTQTSDGYKKVIIDLLRKNGYKIKFT